MAVDVAQISALPRAARTARIGRARLALTVGALLLLAGIAGGVRAQSSVQEPSTPVQPREFAELSGISTNVAVPEAPAPIEDQTTRSSAPAAPAGAAAAAQAPADPPASNSGGQTSVVAGNGTEETETNSGGAHVNNDATVKSQTGMYSGDPEP